jgi:hypothetical protein
MCSNTTHTIRVVISPVVSRQTNKQTEKERQQTQMKNNIKTIMAAVLISSIAAVSQNAFGAATAQQTVTYQVSAINELSVSGNPGALIVSTATAGSAPNVANDSSTSYGITTNESNQKVTGVINSNMPDGLTLSVTLASNGAASEGKKSLSTVATDLVTSISTLNESSQGISYELAATSAAGVVSSATKTVTLTITAGA